MRGKNEGEGREGAKGRLRRRRRKYKLAIAMLHCGDHKNHIKSLGICTLLVEESPKMVEARLPTLGGQ
jgi:hypothetical protein